ncbi:squalene/phytoene synthase family protein [Streptomyces sp. NBC_00588]|uniref:squalene/phytoene synthase family protein n=1 Tax=Streptomyces sp. NBC_00588 TaxID=2975784 RepID=UPI002E80707E|nr:squalene/phytoene synthase family protein [Streptomyces sp. NBC_00588]WUB33787.1 squalene/phytoene synthase family protein [Streptomyces sp. NBC_00588]
MSRWSTALDQCGISDPALRSDYGLQRSAVRRFAPAEYLAVRLLLPPRLHPSVVAAVAFMHETDERIDSGETSARQAALRSWDEQVTAALGQQVRAEQPALPVLRALADTARRHPFMAARVRDFLDGAPTEVAWSGFDTEDAFQAYVDSYSLPALMLTASLLELSPSADKLTFRDGCRTLIEAMQRIDFLADLSEDAAEGRVGVPRDTLARFGLDTTDLARGSGDHLPAVERLVTAQARLAASALDSCRDLPHLVEPEQQPFLETLIAVQHLRLRDVERRGAALLTHGARPDVLATVGLLVRQHRAARRRRRRPGPRRQSG